MWGRKEETPWRWWRCYSCMYSRQHQRQYMPWPNSARPRQCSMVFRQGGLYQPGGIPEHFPIKNTVYLYAFLCLLSHQLTNSGIHKKSVSYLFESITKKITNMSQKQRKSWAGKNCAGVPQWSHVSAPSGAGAVSANAKAAPSKAPAMKYGAFS